MSKIEALVTIAKKLPEQRIDELVDFAGYLFQKEDTNSEIDGLLLSYDVLAEDWLSEADEEAWKDL
ncbi:MAG: hypothetical protein ACHQNE_10025 [Candidatus Kapaibacterium sp.]